jgi:nucleoside-diphosphate-sugar epimerase
MREILVTGGAGYLGSHLVELLLKENYKVRVLDNLSFGDNALKILKKKYKFEFVKGDIRDLRIVLNSMEGCDAVVHLAGIVGDPASKLDPIQSTEINYLSTKLVVDAASYFQIKQFLFASTCSVYGASNNQLLSEQSKLNPVSIYAKTKLKSEEIILENQKNLSPTILRAGTLFGYSNRMRFDLVINLFVAQAVSKNMITIEGGNQWRPFVHVKDAALAYLLTLEKKRGSVKGIFNLGSDDLNYQISEIGKTIQQNIPNVKIKNSRTIDQRNYRVSFKKINKSLKFKTTMSILDGIKEIHHVIKTNKIKDWTDSIYYNNKFPLVGKNKNSKYYWQ